VQSAHVDVFVNAVALKLLVVGGEVLHRRDHLLGLHALDVRHGHARGQVGVLAVTLEVPAPERLRLMLTVARESCSVQAAFTSCAITWPSRRTSSTSQLAPANTRGECGGENRRRGGCRL